jgi:hypothetical protein
VVVLPNGNLVVTDPRYSAPAAAHAGAVYLYDGETHSLISTLTGSQAEDRVGSDGITLLKDGSFVVRSTAWANGAFTQAGALTWCSATLGCAGEVSSTNSLVGTQSNDRIGSSGVSSLDGAAFLVKSPGWSSGAGALTYCASGAVCHGEVSSTNSLTGSAPMDGMGSLVLVLPGEGYVFYAPFWSDGDTQLVGAVTGCPMSGCVGPASAGSSLHGSTAQDQVGVNVIPLGGGGFVVSSENWNRPGAGMDTGAVTFCASVTACNGQTVSPANSLTGLYSSSRVGQTLLALPGGDYVVGSQNWMSSAVDRPGAVTYCHVSSGASDCTNQVITPANSLTGAHSMDAIGIELVALKDGSYVAGSPAWNGFRGAATFCQVTSGSSGCTGQAVSEANSLVGSKSSLSASDGDQVSRDGLTALSGGGYVVASSDWDSGSLDRVGAVTYCPPTGCTGPVTIVNSLTGLTSYDQIGKDGVRELSTGNYVVMSMDWSNDLGAVQVGAVTWCMVIGSAVMSSCNGWNVIPANSLVGSKAEDLVGASNTLAPLSNGGYLVGSPFWSNADLPSAGAITLCPASGCSGPITSANSLLGVQRNEMAGLDALAEVADGYYVASNARFTDSHGSISLCKTDTGCANPISTLNSVIGSIPNSDPGLRMTYAYDALHHQLIVGRPAENLVTFFAYGGVKTDTVTALTSSSTAGASTWGESVQLTAEVSPAGAGGAVSFYEGSVSLCADRPLNDAHQASCTLNDLLIGAHAITAVYSGNANYAASTSNWVTQTVGKAILTVTADDQNKLYAEADPAFTFHYAGFVHGENASQIDTSPSCSVSVPHINVGTYPITCAGGADDRYDFAYKDGAFKISARPITITADPQTITYGDPDPALTFQITSGALVNGDAFSGALTRAAGKNAGSYPIQQGSLALNSNYALTYAGADLSIQPKPASVTPENDTKVYGEADSPFGGALDGFLPGDGVKATYTRAAGESAAASPYQISATLSPATVLDNYTITYHTAGLTIEKRPVMVQAHAKSKIYGNPDPELTCQITSGTLVFGDTLTGHLTRVPGEAIGSAYAIQQGTLALNDNYNLFFVGADLTIYSANSTTTLSVSSAGSAFRQAVIFTAHVTLVPPPTGTASPGTVDFMEGTTYLATSVPLIDGAAQFETRSLPVGAHEIFAVYNGGGIYETSRSLPVTETVHKAAANLAMITDLSQASGVNQAYRVSVEVTSLLGTPTGTVTISDGADSCTFNLSSASSCALISTTAGEKTITATYSGDPVFESGLVTALHSVLYNLFLVWIMGYYLQV